MGASSLIPVVFVLFSTTISILDCQSDIPWRLRRGYVNRTYDVRMDPNLIKGAVDMSNKYFFIAKWNAFQMMAHTVRPPRPEGQNYDIDCYCHVNCTPEEWYRATYQIMREYDRRYSRPLSYLKLCNAYDSYQNVNYCKCEDPFLNYTDPRKRKYQNYEIPKDHVEITYPFRNGDLEIHPFE